MMVTGQSTASASSRAYRSIETILYRICRILTQTGARKVQHSQATRAGTRVLELGRLKLVEFIVEFTQITSLFLSGVCGTK